MEELTSASRAELLRIIARQQAQIADLAARDEESRARIEQLTAQLQQLEEENRRLRQGGGGPARLPERSQGPGISGGTRSAKGSETKMGLMPARPGSLFGTWAAQGKPLLSSCQQLLLDNA